ncbi:LysR family transcriptional regulator [Actinomadura sp. 21ATH]|uniref:LysR family transcriptional regulator n=1 Tax=Actinomadura sp. 21ATH TaxID=1735444 RepID=UPI0035C0E18C
MIDLRRLQVLRAVHRHGTVTAAAEALHLTPSAVSHHLRELAREVRVPLAEPQGRGIRLTAAAYLLVEHADALFARWEETRSALESYREGEAGLLRMCGFASAVVGLLAPAAARLRDEHPGLTVRVSECGTAIGFDLLMSTDADIAIVDPNGDAPPPGDDRFEQHLLVEERHDLLVPAGHPLAARPAVRLAEAAGEDWVIPERGTCDHHERLLTYCAAAGFNPRVAHYATEWPTISALVGHGLGISMIPRMAELAAGRAVVRVPLAGEPMPVRRVLACVRRGSGAHPLVQRGLRALREVVAAAPALGTPEPGGP